MSLGWFSTGNGDGSLGLFNEVHKAIELGILDARIDFVFCNREKGESQGSDRFLDRVSSVGIPTVSLSSSRFRSEHGGGSFDKHRLAYDGEIIKALSQFNVDLCILAGYMLILGKELCQSYRMLNLHPALPGGPTGTWRDVIWKLVEERSKVNGAYVHLVTEELDKGPIITYCSFPIAADESLKSKTGARGLRAIIENALIDVMYHLPSMPKVNKCVVDSDTILGNGQPILLSKNGSLLQIESIEDMTA